MKKHAFLTFLLFFLLFMALTQYFSASTSGVSPSGSLDIDLIEVLEECSQTHFLFGFEEFVKDVQGVKYNFLNLYNAAVADPGSYYDVYVFSTDTSGSVVSDIVDDVMGRAYGSYTIQSIRKPSLSDPLEVLKFIGSCINFFFTSLKSGAQIIFDIFVSVINTVVTFVQLFARLFFRF